MQIFHGLVDSALENAFSRLQKAMLGRLGQLSDGMCLASR